jgi:hypothetical protein
MFVGDVQDERLAARAVRGMAVILDASPFRHRGQSLHHPFHLRTALGRTIVP